MKLSGLPLAFCVSLLLHGAAVSVQYAVGHRNAGIRAIAESNGSETIQIVLEPEEVVPSAPKVLPVAATPREPVPIWSKPVAALPSIEPVNVAATVVSISPDKGLNKNGKQLNSMPSTTETVDSGKPSAANTNPSEIGDDSSDHANYSLNPPPVYPRQALRRREKGLVLLRVFVTAEGSPKIIELKQSSTFSLLDKAAIEAVRQWRFIPAHVGSTPVSSQVEVPVRFKLSD